VGRVKVVGLGRKREKALMVRSREVSRLPVRSDDGHRRKKSIGCEHYYCAFSHAITNPPSSPIANKLWAKTPIGVETGLPEVEGDGMELELELLVLDGSEVLEGGTVLVLLGLAVVLVGEGGGVEDVVVVDVDLGSSLP